MKHLLSIVFALFSVCAIAQTGKISGKISDVTGTSLDATSIRIPKLKIGTTSDNQ